MSKTVHKGKVTNNDGFSHPLIKNIEEPVMEDHTRVIPSYQPILPNSENRISSKILRCTYLPSTNLKEFAVLVSPFSQTTSTLPTVDTVTKCSSCGSKITPLSKIENHTSMTCFFCGKISEVNANVSQSKGLYGLKKIEEDNKNQTSKKVCFVLQVSQYVYEANIHKSIFSCLEALKGEKMSISFILYDKTHAMFINPHNLELTKIKIEAGNKELRQEVDIQIEELFIDVNNDLSELEELIQYVLYEAFYTKDTILPEIAEIISQIMPKNIMKNYFISTIGHKTSETPENNFNSIGNVVKQYQNTIIDRLSQKQTKTELGHSKTLLKLCPNSQFYILPYNVTYQQALENCGFCIAKLYNIKEAKEVQNELYYDLFDKIGKEVFIESVIEIKSQKGIELVTRNKYADSLYGNVEVIEEKSTDKVNRYKISIKRAEPSFILLLHFKAKTNAADKHLVQLHYSLSRQASKESIILNAIPLRGENILESYDDQVIFNHHLKLCVSDWKGQHYKELKESLLQKYSEITWMLKNYSKNEAISFPKTWKHYMLFSFVIDKMINLGKLNSYLIYEMLTQNLEMLAKRLYYRAYRIEGGVIKNVKSIPNVFQKYPTLFVENGKYLYLVFTEPSVQEIKDIFGHFQSVPTLSRMYPQLPILETNKIQRKVIEVIRSNSEHIFLPLKIVDYESYLFTEWIEPSLYDKDEHITFLRKLWRNA